jgi:hypothetical protein
MSKGHVFIAQNSDVDYVRQACALALSIKKYNTINETCIITNDPIPDEYRHAFDHVVNIPWGDAAKNSSWKIENRWKIIHASPFKENIIYDADMLLLSSNDHWWKYFEGRDLAFTSNVTDYRGNIITSDYYRKVFTGNNLPNLYVGAFYFKKTAPAFEFFKWLDIITRDWQSFYKTFLPVATQKFCSIDVSAALAVKFMNIEDYAVIKNSSIPSFTHMKPALQGWSTTPIKWTDTIPSYFDDNCQLTVGSFVQQGLFHYVESEFLQDHMLFKLSRA